MSFTMQVIKSGAGSTVMRTICVCLVMFLSCPVALAQRFAFSAADTDEKLATALPVLAKQIIAVYADPNRGRYLGNLFRLQMSAGDYSAASATIQELETLTKAQNPTSSISNFTPDVIMASAMARRAVTGQSLEDTSKEAFEDLFNKLNDKAAYDAIYWLWGPVGRFHDLAVQTAAKSAASGYIELGDALDLIRFYQLYVEYQALIPLVDPLIKADDSRRYVIQNDVLIRAKDGDTLCALVVHPRSAPERRPTALNFTIYVENKLDKARQAAARGYVGVVATTRGKACSPDQPVPYVFDARDAYAVIDWISKQPWSDGRVGMYGGSYEGFTQWAAAKTLHPALKTIVPYVANNPGLGLPMENNVFLYSNYAFNFYAADNNTVDDATYNDTTRWNALNKTWYASGRPYREIDLIDGKPNPVLQRQLKHPSYDKYWQDMTPYRDEFAKIKIPVLSITGYFEDNLPTLQFFTDHYKYNKNAQHYLVIGPYDHFGSQATQKPGVVNGYTIDPAAQFDTTELTYQWFDYVLRDGKKPPLLADKVNYEVMGANVWRHAPSLDRMSNGKWLLYLTNSKDGERYRLDPRRPAKAGSVEQTMDFSDRSTSVNLYPEAPLQSSINISGVLAFVSEPISEPFSVDGRITANIKAVIDKRDMDLSLAVYEITPDGKYFNLSYYLGRASYASDMSVRKLLRPGAVTSIPIVRTLLVSRQLSKGSRLLVLLTVNKNDFAQINYGTGKDVSDESIADAKTPLHVRWKNDSYITVPIRK